VPRINQRFVIPDPRRAGAMRRIVEKVPCFFLSRKKTFLFRGKEAKDFLIMNGSAWIMSLFLGECLVSWCRRVEFFDREFRRDGGRMDQDIGDAPSQQPGRLPFPRKRTGLLS
jgi:hypothetical protein